MFQKICSENWTSGKWNAIFTTSPKTFWHQVKKFSLTVRKNFQNSNYFSENIFLKNDPLDNAVLTTTTKIFTMFPKEIRTILKNYTELIFFKNNVPQYSYSGQVLLDSSNAVFTNLPKKLSGVSTKICSKSPNI